MTRSILVVIAFLAIVTSAKSQTQSDTSDAYWEVVRPIPASKDIDMKKCLVGSAKDSMIVGFVQNIGSWKFRTDSIYFRGPDAKAFNMTSGFPPFILDAGNSQTVELLFKPTRAGIHNAEIVIITQTDTILKKIQGEGVLPTIQVMNKLIDFGKIELDLTKDSLKAVTIKNNGLTAINISKIVHAGPNDKDFITLAGNNLKVLNPGDTAKLDLRFKPSDVGRTSGTIEFYHDGLNSPAVVMLFGECLNHPPKIQSNSPVFRNLNCEASDTQIITIKNIGGYPLNVSKIDISGQDKSDFKIVGTIPFSLDQDSAMDISVIFQPTTSGAKTANLTITSNSIVNPEIIYQLKGNKEFISYTIENDKLDLGWTGLNKSQTKTFKIKNTGTIPNTYKLSIMGQVQISPTDFTLNPNEEKEITMITPALTSNQVLDEKLTITETSCNSITDYKVKYGVVSATASLAVKYIEASPGDEIDIPIYLNDKSFLLESGVTKFNVDLSFNKTLLVPIGSTPVGKFDGNSIIVPLELTVNPDENGILSKFKFKVGLGNDSITQLKLSNAKTDVSTVEVQAISGTLKVLGICNSGGARLVNPEGEVKLTIIRPNPVEDIGKLEVETIESGYTEIFIVNLLGDKIADIFCGNLSNGKLTIPVNTKDLNNGSYLIILQTPTVIKSLRMEIIK